MKPSGAGTALYALTLLVSLSLSNKFAQLCYLSKLKTGLAKVLWFLMGDLHICIYVYMYICVCIYIYTYRRMCIYICVCVAYKLTTRNGHGQSGWSPIACEDFDTHKFCRGPAMVCRIWSPFIMDSVLGAENGGFPKWGYPHIFHSNKIL